MAYQRKTYRRDDIIRAFAPDDVVRAQELYLSTNDPAFIALAIGHSPSGPPNWAIIAAAELAHAVGLNHEAGLNRDLIGLRLDRMILEYLRLAPLPEPGVQAWDGKRPGRGKRSLPHSSLDKLIRHVLSSEGIEEHTAEFAAARQRLIEAWNREAAQATEKDGTGMPMTTRFRRVALEALDNSGAWFRRNHALAAWITSGA